MIGRTAYRASNKTAKLDPTYEKMINITMRKIASADEHGLLKTMKPNLARRGRKKD